MAEEAVILRARRKLSAVQAVRVVIVMNGNRVTRAVVPAVMGDARGAERHHPRKEHGECPESGTAEMAQVDHGSRDFTRGVKPCQRRGGK